MPLVWIGAAAGLFGLVHAFSKPRAGRRTVAVLSNGKAPNVVFDGSVWRPTGSEDLATVQEWAATGARMADIFETPHEWDAAALGFKP